MAEPGLLLVDKPAGMTSHDVVNAVRRELEERRVGHTGTLDPFATGLLLVCVGVFTRAAEYFNGLPKSYDAVMRLGCETDTGDPTGATVSENEAWRDVSAQQLTEAVASLVGPLMQVPSRFSAKKVDGVRAYARARSGDEPDLEAVPVTVHDAAVDSIDGRDVAFRVTASTGTYVRALARDLGREFGCGAHLTSLRRTAIGPFDVGAACSPHGAGQAVSDGAAAWRPSGSALEWMPARVLTPDEVVEIGHGRAIGALGEQGTLALVAGDRLVAIGEVDGGDVRPRKVFPE